MLLRLQAAASSSPELPAVLAHVCSYLAVVLECAAQQISWLDSKGIAPHFEAALLAVDSALQLWPLCTQLAAAVGGRGRLPQQLQQALTDLLADIELLWSIASLKTYGVLLTAQGTEAHAAAIAACSTHSQLLWRLSSTATRVLHAVLRQGGGEAPLRLLCSLSATVLLALAGCNSDADRCVGMLTRGVCSPCFPAPHAVLLSYGIRCCCRHQRCCVCYLHSAMPRLPACWNSSGRLLSCAAACAGGRSPQRMQKRAAPWLPPPPPFSCQRRFSYLRCRLAHHCMPRWGHCAWVLE